MYKIKRQTVSFIKSEHFPFFVLTIFLWMVHACIKLQGEGDDTYFQSALRDYSLIDWTVFRYNNWTSRNLIEIVLIIIAGHHNLWKVLNVAMMALGAISISKIFSDNKSKITNWMICVLFLCLPISIYNSAGWITTTINYSWVLCLGLFAMIPIKKIIYKEKISWYEYIFYFFAMIYATNLEQMCFILLVVYCVFTCYERYLNRKFNWFLLSGVMINFASLIFIVTCPGNVSRKASEIVTWFPDYGNLSFFRKIEMGYSSTLFEFIMRVNWIFWFFAVVLFVCVFLKNKNIFYRVVSLIPILCNFIFSFFVKLFGNYFPGLLEVKHSMTQYGTGLSLNPATWIPDVILSLVCISILISLYAIFEDKKMYIFTVFILLLGFASRMMMSFSPTIWASNTRTFLYMYISILICSIILFQKLLEYKMKRSKLS